MARNSHSRLSAMQRRHAPLLLVVVVLLSGCQGKSLVDDNPVFAEAPPRRSLTNKSTVASSDDEEGESQIQAVSFTGSSKTKIVGNTVVAEVNGRPIFVDDLIGSLRLAIEAEESLSDEQRQQILEKQIKGRLDNYIEQEIVVQALKQKIPEDRQQVIEESLEKPFGEVIANIKKDRKLTTDEELNQVLSTEGLSVDLLRESFFRIQMVNGYLSTIAESPDTISRLEMLAHYDEHSEEFTTQERIRWQELVVLFTSNDGREGAEARMTEVVQQLQKDVDFAELATNYSDALSAEKRGDMGWLTRGSLSDNALEEQLFSLPSGGMTKVYVRDDRFEVYRVVDHQPARTAPFQEMQKEIEQRIRAEKAKAARQKTMQDLRAKASVVTMFDNEPKS
ncbi:MAG: peptidylprolyl isomerase [Fuerstiella sp.]|nr:peptidylprolyl isomerase [Fuerstiella sp.]